MVLYIHNQFFKIKDMIVGTTKSTQCSNVQKFLITLMQEKEGLSQEEAEQKLKAGASVKDFIKKETK